MRIIKFRKWDEDDQIMISGDDLAFEEYAPITELLTQDGIMQWTGLTDRHGVEIYEGDIINTTSIYKDIWPPRIQMVVSDLECPGSLIFNPCSGAIFEVIGNIHANPELVPE